MRALVTGGAGFIGSSIVDALVDRGADVVVLDDLVTGFAEHVHPKADFRKASITDEAAVRDAVAGCEVVFHQAAHRAVFRSVEAPLATNEANVTGTLAVLVAARDAGVRRLISASSSSVYGGVAPVPTPETAPLLPRSPYAVTKMTGEHYARVFAELFGLETVSLRYFNVYGPRQRPDSQYAAVIPLFIDALRRGEAPTVHGDGKQNRDFTFITDVVRANLLAAEAPAPAVSGRAFNIAGGTPHDLLELLAHLNDLLGTRIEPRHVGPRAGDVRQSCADTTAAREAFGFETTVGFADGLAATVEWFRDRPAA